MHPLPSFTNGSSCEVRAQLSLAFNVTCPLGGVLAGVQHAFLRHALVTVTFAEGACQLRMCSGLYSDARNPGTEQRQGGASNPNPVFESQPSRGQRTASEPEKGPSTAAATFRSLFKRRERTDTS